jgi:hypothetical protein
MLVRIWLLSYLDVHLVLRNKLRVVQKTIGLGDKLGQEGYSLVQRAVVQKLRDTVFEVGFLSRLSQQTINHLVTTRLLHIPSRV